MKRIWMVGALALLVGAVAATPAGATGNSANAKLCQKGGWKNLVRSDGSSFKNQGKCVSYAAKGGVLTTPPATFQSTCQGLGGTYGTGGTIAGFRVTDRCDWASVPLATFLGAIDTLWPFCPGYPDPNTRPKNERTPGDPTAGAIGCRDFS